MKLLNNLRWKPFWTSYIGCIMGCLEYLGINISSEWVFGGSGYAFIINIHETVCPSGPTAWIREPVNILGRNLGYELIGVHSNKYASDYYEKKKVAWNMIRNAIDNNYPCFGWEIDIPPEYYVIYGYDEIGYYYSGPNCIYGKGPKPWREIADMDTGVLEVYVLKPKNIEDKVKIIRDAFKFAIEFSNSPNKWTYPKYATGPNGYDLWINALKKGIASDIGVSYNAAVWSECRSYAVKFLEKAKESIDIELEELFNEAIKYYNITANSLKELTKIFPFPLEKGATRDESKCEKAINYLMEAKEAEINGLKILSEILMKLK